MTANRIERFLTTCIENSNGVERFADQYLLAPLHFLLTQKSGPDRIERYRIEGSRVEWLPNRSAPPDSQIFRIFKIFCALIGALLLTIPAVLIKRLAQCTQAASALHRVLDDHRTSQAAKAVQLRPLNNKVFNDAKGAVLCCAVGYLSLKRIGAVFSVCKTWNKSLRQQELPLWRAIALRFPEYRQQNLSEASIKQTRGWMQTALIAIKNDFASCEGFVSAFGGTEKLLLMPCVKSRGTATNGPFIPPEVLTQELPVPAFRAFHTVPDEANQKGVTLRIVRTLGNAMIVPYPNPAVVPPGEPEHMTAGSTLITLKFIFGEWLGPVARFGTFQHVVGELWPHACWPESSLSMGSYTSGAGLRWLQDLLAGKTCGPFPGMDYAGSPAPQVTYRLWNLQKWGHPVAQQN